MTQKKEVSKSSMAISPKAMKEPKAKNRKLKTENGSAVATEENMMAEDSSNTTLFVSRLQHNLGFKNFKLHFEQFGKVTNCYLGQSGCGNSNKGYGFVTFETEQDMRKALEAEHELNGRAALVKINHPKPNTSVKRKREGDSSADPHSKKLRQLINHELYVGGLPPDTSEKKIRKHFSQFGEVVNVFVPKKMDGKGLRFFFVSFEEASSLQAALEAKEHKINKTQARIQLRKDGKNVDAPVERKVSSALLRNADPEAHERTLFVGQLDYASKPTTVLEHFSKYGKVTGLTMPRHPRKEHQNKGFALVEFDTSLAYEKALKAKKHKIDDKVLKVTESQEPKTKGKKDKKKKQKEEVVIDTEKYELFVSDIPDSINNKALEIHFNRYGKVVTVNRPMKQNQGKLRKYAFIQYKTREAFMSALADTNHKIAGEPLTVRESKGTDKKETGKENVKKVRAVFMKVDDEEEEEEEEEDDEDEEEDEDEDDE